MFALFAGFAAECHPSAAFEVGPENLALAEAVLASVAGLGGHDAVLRFLDAAIGTQGIVECTYAVGRAEADAVESHGLIPPGITFLAAVGSRRGPPEREWGIALDASATADGCGLAAPLDVAKNPMHVGNMLSLHQPEQVIAKLEQRECSRYSCGLEILDVEHPVIEIPAGQGILHENGSEHRITLDERFLCAVCIPTAVERAVGIVRLECGHGDCNALLHDGCIQCMQIRHEIGMRDRACVGNREGKGNANGHVGVEGCRRQRKEGAEGKGGKEAGRL